MRRQLMKADDAALDMLIFPYLASYKIDGIRIAVDGNVPYTYARLNVPNWYINAQFAQVPFLLDRFDGELVVGPPNAKDVFARTTSLLRSKKKCEPFTFYVFDRIGPGKYTTRFNPDPLMMPPWVTIIPQTLINNKEELDAFTAKAQAEGYEGVMLRNPEGVYKPGRATVCENNMLRIKPFAHSEGVIIGFEEMMSEVVKGRRSKVQKRPTGMLGSVLLSVPKFPGLIVKVHAGFTYKQRKEIWDDRPGYLNRWVRFKYQSCGTNRLPRSASFDGFREEFDM